MSASTTCLIRDSIPTGPRGGRANRSGSDGPRSMPRVAGGWHVLLFGSRRVLEPSERIAEVLHAVRAAADQAQAHALTTSADVRGAVGVFLLVFLSTLPVAIPFIVMTHARSALRVSNAIAITMLFIAGVALAVSSMGHMDVRHRDGGAGRRARRAHDGTRRLDACVRHP